MQKCLHNQLIILTMVNYLHLFWKQMQYSFYFLIVWNQFVILLGANQKLLCRRCHHHTEVTSRRDRLLQVDWSVYNSKGLLELVDCSSLILFWTKSPLYHLHSSQVQLLIFRHFIFGRRWPQRQNCRSLFKQHTPLSVWLQCNTWITTRGPNLTRDLHFASWTDGQHYYCQLIK